VGAIFAQPVRLSPPLGVLLERLKLRTPERFDLLEPLAKLTERLAPKAVNSDPSVVFLVIFSDQAGFSKDAKVPADRRRAHRERFGKLSGTPGLLAQQMDDSAPGRLRERGQRAVDRAICHRSLDCESAA
jgi:hypothetical protein